MANESKCNFTALVHEAKERLPEAKKHFLHLLGFYETYHRAIQGDHEEEMACEALFCGFLDLLLLQLQAPYPFEHYHQKIRTPYDYHEFGMRFLRPLVKLQESRLLGEHVLKKIETQIKQGDNVILLANHQTESDPQALGVLLEKNYATLNDNLIFIAGERVTTDPLAVPFSLGCNLLCIYSKRYIDHPPELKHKKQLHNKKTMDIMSQLLSEGGHAIYVAPSGGRDRKNANSVIEVAPFDPQSIEMLYLMAARAKRKVHFYPLSLATYDVLPPPSTIQTELGETRITNKVPIGAEFGAEIDMTAFQAEDKHTKRKNRADFIEARVKEGYQTLCQMLNIPF